MNTRSNGFTLIEMMITVALIGILATIALPSYTYYVMRGKIPQATTGLSAIRMAMEQSYQDQRMYRQSACNEAKKLNDVTYGTEFTFDCDVAGSRQGFTATATGNTGGTMESFAYSIDQSGNQRTTSLPSRAGWTGGHKLPLNCWVTKKGGQC